MSTATIVIETDEMSPECRVGIGVFGEGRARKLAEKMIDVATKYFAENGEVTKTEAQQQ